MMRTGAESINAALPAIPGSKEGDYQKITGDSGKSTTAAYAPRTIIAFPEKTFENCLKSPALERALEIQLNDIGTEEGHDLVTEGDVERATAVYLVHDVSLIFEKLLRDEKIPGKYQCLGQSTTEKSRPDISFIVGGQPILFLEYKNTYVFYLLVSRLLLLTAF